MNLTLSGYNLGVNTFTVCANKSVAWKNIRYGALGYEENTNYPIVSGLASSILCSAYSFQWDTENACSSALDVRAILDTETIILCAYVIATPATSAIYFYNPYQLIISQKILTDTSVSATAYFQQVSTNQLIPVNNSNVMWYTLPTTTELTAISTTPITFNQPIYGNSTILSTILLSSTIANYQGFQLNLSSSTGISTAYTQIGINVPIIIKVLTLSTSYLTMSATQYNTGLNTSKQLSWNIIPHTNNIETLSSNYIPLTFNTAYSALTAGLVAISTLDLSNSYIYTLSSYTGVVSGLFRPYLNLTNNSTLSVSIFNIEEHLQQHHYDLDVHGKTNGITHNLPENYYLVWKNTTNNTGILTKKVNNDDYVYNTIDTVSNIENLNLYIIPTSTTTYPMLCTYSFTVCALSGTTTNDALYTTAFNIYVQEWLDNTLFNPAFTFQYESSTLNTIYRPLTSGNYKITNNSTLPPSSVGNLIYTFDDEIVTLAYNTITGNALPECYHYFNGNTSTVCAITLSIETSTVNYTNYVIKDAPIKYIVFTRFPIASSFILYPEFMWNNTSWCPVVTSDLINSEILLSDAVLSAYSFCHIENFYVSCAEISAISYIWSVQNSLNNTDQTITTLTAPTGWLPVMTPSGTTTHSVCVAIFTTDLPVDMPIFYYDDELGQKYPNFSSTFDAPNTIHRKHIDFFGMEDIGVTPDIKCIETNPAGIPCNIYLTGGYNYNGTQVNNTPFNYYLGNFTFNLSSNYAENKIASNLLVDTAVVKISINVDDIGNGYLCFPKFEINNIDIIPIIGITPSLKIAHPSALSNTWCFNNTYLTSYNNKQTLTVYPVIPLIYTQNKYVLTGNNVKFENLAKCFSGIQDFTWIDRGNTKIEKTCVPYITTFNNESIVDLTLNTQFSSYDGVLLLSNENKNIINVDPSYTAYDININRSINITQLELPYDLQSVEIGTNEWLVADSFNACMIKLYNNLTYLESMSQLYDVPPTEYYGWLGTSYYHNSSKKFRWYVNSPNINYGYNTPNIATDDVFTNLKDIFVRDNMMYVSNGTNISVLSSDFKATILSTLDYKTIGDNFINIKTITLDTNNRIYLLDNIKNTITVMNFDINTKVWTLLYGWGGFGDKNSKTKFNTPNDMFIDSLNNLWVADTNNNCIKQFTKTGSWLQTITSDLFNGDPPLSVVVNDNVFVLTNSKIISFSKSGVYINSKTLNTTGAKTIRPCSDSGFIYICYINKIVKYMYNTGTEAIFANNEFLNYSENYQNVFHDEFRNVYIVGTNHILKYIDKLFLINLKQDTSNIMWQLESVLVDKNEYIQDFPINRCVQRFYDNLELFRKSLLGKFSYKTVQTITTITTISTVSIPSVDNFDYCNMDFLYTNGKYLTTDIIFEYLKPDIRTFTEEEYKQLPYHKEQIYIGINELVSAPVLNRPLKKLFECQQTLLEMIS